MSGIIYCVCSDALVIDIRQVARSVKEFFTSSERSLAGFAISARFPDLIALVASNACSFAEFFSAGKGCQQQVEFVNQISDLGTVHFLRGRGGWWDLGGGHRKKKGLKGGAI